MRPWPTATAGTIIVPTVIGLFGNGAIIVGRTTIIGGRITITYQYIIGKIQQQLRYYNRHYYRTYLSAVRVLICNTGQITA